MYNGVTVNYSTCKNNFSLIWGNGLRTPGLGPRNLDSASLCYKRSRRKVQSRARQVTAEEGPRPGSDHQRTSSRWRRLYFCVCPFHRSLWHQLERTSRRPERRGLWVFSVFCAWFLALSILNSKTKRLLSLGRCCEAWHSAALPKKFI